MLDTDRKPELPGEVVSDWPTISDYPQSLTDTVIAGEERRVTTRGVPLATLDQEPPLVTIVTIVFNNERHLERAMRSVFDLEYPNVEYIVVDGGSTDGTLDIIRRYAERLSYWHSKNDRGISDAFNSGVALSRGKYVALVNSDDWMEPRQISNAVEVLEDSGAPFVFGDLLYHNADGSKAYRIVGDEKYARHVWHRMPQFTHPTSVARRDVYERCGLFSLDWKIGMDYDWLLRLYRLGVVGRHSSNVVGHMSLGGVSDESWRRGLRETRKISIKHGGGVVGAWAYYLGRYWRSRARRILEKVIPKRAMMWVRHRITIAMREIED